MTDATRENTGVARGVGRTALMVAAARAIETHRPDALARDPYAEHFVRAAGRAFANWPVRPRQVPGGDTDPLWGRLGRYFGLRTRALDDFLLARARAGTRQVVLLGAGLDSRAYRLDWPPGCTVFEIDQGPVLAFKHGVLDGLRAAPRAERVTIAADLRHDWAGALTAARFDPARPTTWLAEGLLLYLPSAAEQLLMETVAGLSAAGSALAYEVKLGTESAAVRDSPVYSAARLRIGVDLLALFDGEPRPDTAGDLAARGWSTTVRTPFDFTSRSGRGPRPEPHDALAANRWVFAHAPHR
ncbi:class I SAM-dependent methyltransferase [Streptomyces botrytidirepellens]|uniref:S-adenosyl-L-methionine-dependent methyltransferase n=1 Tax=Streptomyces botrytidirepellens TaxID=2486417 RepID=A0A3M8TP62_9ACTN|nr:class I SAM-dependent methyltransferase [Streptomyces botrytidirepellens]RNF93906.1 SAM-dependent methyltransferase [Streptomyces botrytidirepellens]